MIKLKLIFIAVYFAILYTIAFFSNLHYRDKKEDFLWISKSQWSAIMVMWLPSLVVLAK